MHKLLHILLFSAAYVFLFLFSPLMIIAHAQLSGCGQFDVGNPNSNQKPPAQCQSGGGFTNPFPGGWEPSRLDMGYDGTFKGFIVAPFPGTIISASNSFSNWGGYMELKSDQKLSGLPTSTFYFGEGIAVVAHTGQHVNAGDRIARPVPSVWNGIVGNIEFGLATDGPVGGPTDPYVEPRFNRPNPRQAVLDWTTWVEQNLHVAPPATTDHAGYP